ncbi:LOW QUALITY PROTEIN: hypothetical protein Cgig2_007236 [Carnegiea gigantea]|uniref:Major facilitator superfamily (MFS) profile domain-containing protein n=1 Tax=Carnegiea gigantea TaxID=171969 RepID=A0A9Q1QQP2_9CARY|nr:LOW QUALITY PROTEIN: hypothetical protein Cgig2_007236 [Carnegiea gigantea]
MGLMVRMEMVPPPSPVESLLIFSPSSCSQTPPSLAYWGRPVCMDPCYSRLWVFFQLLVYCDLPDLADCCCYQSHTMVRCRLVGVGEASFISLAAPFIDDNAPVAQKTAWLAVFYMCIPTGIALGYVYGGLFGDAVKQNAENCTFSFPPVGDFFNWRIAFWGEAILMLPFAVLGFVMKPLQLKGFTHNQLKDALISEDASESLNQDTRCDEQTQDQASYEVPTKASKFEAAFDIRSQFSRFSKDMMALLHEEVYVVNILGYICYNFVIGAYSYWGPKAGYNIYQMTNADMLFGAITIVCGILGTLSGGFILDRMNATIPNAFKLLSGATLLGAAFCFSAFCFRSLNVFLLLFAVGELLVFATQAPVNYVCLHSVKPSLRPLSMAISTVSIHVFGDVPSSPLVGVLQDYINNWRETALILTSILFLAAGVWLIGVFLNGVDRFDEDELSAMQIKECAEPLLDGGQTQSSEP